MRPQDPQFATRVRDSFARQNAMALIGASLRKVEAGEVEIALPWRDDLTQQKGFIHGGVLGMIAEAVDGQAGTVVVPDER